MIDKLRHLELFAGIGGFSLALKNAYKGEIQTAYSEKAMEYREFQDQFIKDGKYRVVDREDSTLQLQWYVYKNTRRYFHTVNVDKKSLIDIVLLTIEMFPEEFKKERKK
jgi:hypothetical protein